MATTDDYTVTVKPQEIYLDFTAKNMVTIPCTQYDKDARTLHIHLLDNGKLFCLDSTMHELLFKMTKKDNKTILNDCTIDSDGTASFVLTEQICIFDGIYDIQFMLANHTDKTIIHTIPARLNISKSVADHIEIESSDEFDTLNRMILDNEDTKNKLLQTKADMENFQLNAESQENIRQTNETIRQEKEAARQTNETARQENESFRETKEAARTASEEQRTTNETTRSQAETLRVQAENNRNTNEENRITAFADMKQMVTDMNTTISQNKSVWDDKYTKNEVDNKFSTLETNIDWKESVNTYQDIASTYPNPQDGWTVNVKDTDYTYRYNGTNWVTISANAIPKATQTVDGLLTKEDKTNYDDANSKKHVHNNQSVLDSITSDEKALWNTVSNKVDKYSSKIELSDDDCIGTIQYCSPDYFYLKGANRELLFRVGGGVSPQLGTATVGSSTNPTYIKNGIITECEHCLETDVPFDAKFTDTIYTLPVASSAVLGGVKTGSNITNSSGTISLTKENVVNALGYTPGTGNGSVTGVKGNAESSYRTGNVNITPANIGAATSSHTHNYAGSSSAGGSANSAVKLNSSAGSSTQPVYFSNGKPVACNYTLGTACKYNIVENASDTVWGKVTRINDAGVIEVGKYIDFHVTNEVKDYDYRIEAVTNKLIFSGSISAYNDALKESNCNVVMATTANQVTLKWTGTQLDLYIDNTRIGKIVTD